MQQAQDLKAPPVPRKMTTVGGFAVSTKGMAPQQSGQSGERVVADQAEDPKAEAKSEALALISRLVDIIGELDSDRPIQAAELTRVAKRQVDAIDGYVQYLARVKAVPHTCPRCEKAVTHDPKGQTFCEGCVSATFGRPRV